jgi:N-acetylglucosamine-6-sulfatase
VPLARHNETYTDLTAPQDASFNPDQNYTDQKPSWIKDLTELTSTQIERINLHYRRRIQALQGIDEIVHDVVELLDAKGVLNNTYSEYLFPIKDNR